MGMGQKDIDREMEIGGNIESAGTIRFDTVVQSGRTRSRVSDIETEEGGQYGDRVVGQPRRRRRWSRKHYGEV